MTPEELREWSARLMGWKEMGPVGNLKWWGTWETNVSIFPPTLTEKGIILKKNWTPDLPTAPASQILGVIERMRELGWAFSCWCHARKSNREYCAEFKEDTGITGNIITTKVFAAILPKAVLEAAWATGVKR